MSESFIARLLDGLFYEDLEMLIRLATDRTVELEAQFAGA